MSQVAAQRTHQPMHRKRKRHIEHQDEQKRAARTHDVVVADQARREPRAGAYGDREVNHHVPDAVKERDIAAEHRERTTAQQPQTRVALYEARGCDADAARKGEQHRLAAGGPADQPKQRHDNAEATGNRCHDDRGWVVRHDRPAQHHNRNHGNRGDHSGNHRPPYQPDTSGVQIKA